MNKPFSIYGKLPSGNYRIKGGKRRKTGKPDPGRNGPVFVRHEGQTMAEATILRP